MSLDGKSLPKLELEKCAVYIDDGKMIIQVRSECVKTMKKGTNSMGSFTLIAYELEYTYEVNLLDDELSLYYQPSIDSEKHYVGNDKLPQSTTS